ncbi:hypothetical protein E8E11_003117 [Didymella keratinophila]|nr:hypothetical protein E8E11_003117 [Didymella keratinophila]
MSTRRLYDCFDTDKKGHFEAVDELFDKGVWIGYFAEESRDTRYRGLPSYHDLEKNHENLSFPFPEPLPNASYVDREAFCRGCVSEDSIVLQLREVRFGPRHKVIVMPLRRADEAGLFCIILQQSLDRSVTALDLFRPYEHGIDRNDSKPFANDIMLLAVRDRDNSGSSVLSTVRKALDPAELARIANRNSSSKANTHPTPRSKAESVPQSGGQPRYKPKRKQQQTDAEDSASGSPAKRNRQVPLTGPRMREDNGSISDDDMDDTPLVLKARGLASRPREQQRTPVSPNSALNPLPTEAPRPPVVNMNDLQFTDEQARRIFFI